MTPRYLTEATPAQVDRLVRPLLAARLFPDEVTLRAVLHARPWAIQASRRGDVAVLGRWRDHLGLLAIEALWCSHRHLGEAIADLDECAARNGYSGLVSPPVLEVDVPLYRAAGMVTRETLETLELALQPAGNGGMDGGPRGGSEAPLAPGRDESVVVRPAVDDDLPVILDVDSGCFEPFWRYDRRSLERFCTAGGLALAERDGRCLGYTLVTMDRDAAVLGRLCVDARYRRRGVGLSLLASALESVRAAGAVHVTLSTQHDNSGAMALYRKAGFRLTGRRYAFLTLGQDVRGGEGDRIGALMGD